MGSLLYLFLMRVSVRFSSTLGFSPFLVIGFLLEDIFGISDKPFIVDEDQLIYFRS